MTVGHLCLALSRHHAGIVSLLTFELALHPPGILSLPCPVTFLLLLNLVWTGAQANGKTSGHSLISVLLKPVGVWVQANGETSGHAVNVPDEVLLQANDSHQVANYANMSANDTDEPKVSLHYLSSAQGRAKKVPDRAAKVFVLACFTLAETLNGMILRADRVALLMANFVAIQFK